MQAGGALGESQTPRRVGIQSQLPYYESVSLPFISKPNWDHSCGLQGKQSQPAFYIISQLEMVLREPVTPLGLHTCSNGTCRFPEGSKTVTPRAILGQENGTEGLSAFSPYSAHTWKS